MASWTQNALNDAPVLADDVSQVATHALDVARRSFTAITNTAESVARNVIHSITATASSTQALAQSVISSTVQWVGDTASRVRGMALSVVVSLASGLGQLRTALVGGMANVIGVAGTIASRVGTVVNAGLAVITNVAGTVAGFLTGGGMGGRVGALAQGVAARIAVGVEAVVANVIGATQQLGAFVVQGIQAAATMAYNAGAAMARATVSVLRTIVDVTMSAIEAGIEAGPYGIAAAMAVVGIVGNFALAIVSRMLTAAANAAGFVMRVASTIASALGPIVTSIFTWVAGTLTTVATVLRTTVGAVVNVARRAFSTLAGWAGTAWDWVTGVVSRSFTFITSNIGTVVSVVSSIAQTALTFGVAVAQIVGIVSLMGIFAAAVYQVAQSALQMAQNAKTFGAMTGYGLGQSAGILNRFGIQGVGAQSVTSAFGNQSPWVFGMKARVFGLPGYDAPDFGEQLARRFQSLNAGGPMQQIMARAMMRTLGLDSPDFLRLASTSPATQHANTTYQRTIDANLGLSPGAMARYAEEIPASLSRIGYAFQAIGNTLAANALPMIEAVLGTITKTIGEQAGGIRSFVERACRFMFVSAPIILADGVVRVTAMVAAGLTNLLKWTTWIVTTLPAVLAAGAQAVANTLRNWALSFATFAQNFINGFVGFLSNLGITLAGWISRVGNGIADQIDALANWMQSVWSNQNNPFRVMIMSIARGLDTIINTAREFVGQMARLGALLNNAVILNTAGVAALLGLRWQSPSAAYANATQGVGVSTLEDQARRFFAGPTITRWAGGLANSAATLRTNTTNAANNVAGGMNDLAVNAGTSAANVANGIIRGMNGLADMIATRDGRHNIGREVGDTLANFMRPALGPLSQLAQGANNLSNMATAYRQSLGTEDERRGRWQELIDATKEVSNTIRQEARRGGGTGSASGDEIVSLMLSRFARDQGRAVRSYGGGGTA